MGLDTTHGCWHGAYSAFHRWRSKIAQLAGLPPLDFMDGFWTGIGPGAFGVGLSIKCDLDALDRWAQTADKSYRPAEYLRCWFDDMRPISWEALRPDPLHILLRHSDCDGEIETKDCGPIADRLEELMPHMRQRAEDAGHIGNWADRTQAFIDGLRRAAGAGENVEFR